MNTDGIRSLDIYRIYFTVNFRWIQHVLFLAWAWLAKAKGHSCHTKKSTLAKTFTEKKRVKVRSTPATTLQKKDPIE